MITAAVLGFALLGFALEEALNPRLKTRAATTSWRKVESPKEKRAPDSQKKNLANA